MADRYRCFATRDQFRTFFSQVVTSKISSALLSSTLFALSPAFPNPYDSEAQNVSTVLAGGVPWLAHSQPNQIQRQKVQLACCHLPFCLLAQLHTIQMGLRCIRLTLRIVSSAVIQYSVHLWHILTNEDRDRDIRELQIFKMGPFCRSSRSGQYRSDTFKLSTAKA